MTGTEFLQRCAAHGGNWTAMLMSGIKECFPEYYEKLEDKEYSFEEVLKMTTKCGVDWDK